MSDYDKIAQEKLELAFNYADLILSGVIISCKFTKLSCQRFKDDLANTDETRFRFSEERALHVLKFFAGGVTHVKGALSGKPIDLMDFHAFLLVNLFGWEKPYMETDPQTGATLGQLIEDDEPVWARRFKTVYFEVARKNAKSTISSGIMAYMTAFDGEGGSECYSAATTRDQAKIVYQDCVNMVKKSPLMGAALKPTAYCIKEIYGTGIATALSADHGTLDGLNTHLAVCDELHAHKSRGVWDVLETSTGARRSPLIIGITTAGFILDGICMEVRNYCEKVLDGTVEDDSFWGIIYTIDEDDDEFDEKVWFKANPALGIAKSWDDMRRLAKKAKEEPTARPNYYTKHLNVWVNGEFSWMDMTKWLKCPVSDSMSGDKCYVGVDFAEKLDLCSAVKVRVTDDGHVHTYVKAWIPEETAKKAPKHVADLYRKYAEKGELTLMDGDVIDFDEIETDIKAWLKGEDLEYICYDPWNATQFANRMDDDGYPMFEVAMTAKNLSEPMKQLQVLAYQGKLHHEHSGLYNWTVSNVMVQPDRNQNIFPRKQNEASKIDPAVATFIVMNRVVLDLEEYSPLDDVDDDDLSNMAV